MNDYADAAQRHYLSAVCLLQTHPATASHCFGIAAECVLKTLMCNLQPQVNKVSAKHLGSHLWTEFANHQTVQTHPSRVAWAQKYQANFQNWDVNDRYRHHADARFRAGVLDGQARGAQGLVGLLQLIQKGLA